MSPARPSSGPSVRSNADQESLSRADDANPVLLRPPVDANEQFELPLQSPPLSRSTCRAEHRPLYWRSARMGRRRLPTGFSTRTAAPGCTSFPGARLAQGQKALLAGSRVSTGLLHPVDI